MTKTRLLSTAAIALAFGLTAALNGASAQSQPNPEPAPAAQQNAPPAKIAPSMNAGEHKAPGKPETTGQAAKEPKPGHVQAGESEKSSADVKAKYDSRATTDTHKEFSKDSAAAKTGESSKSSTTGQGAAAGSAKLSAEQRTKITTVIKKQNVKSVHVNFSINIGTRVPPTVHYYPLPTEVVTIYPEWRGYDYILVGDQVVVIDPDRHEIVAILDV